MSDLDLDIMDLKLESPNEQDKIQDEKLLSPLDEFNEFLSQLWDMIKTDFQNSLNFISSNRSFFTTAVILAILLKVSSITNLGASFEKYCGGRGMRGGGDFAPQVAMFKDVQAAKAQELADLKTKKKDQKRDAQIQKKADKLADKEAKKVAKDSSYQAKTMNSLTGEAEQSVKSKADAKALKQGKAALISQYKEGKSEAREQDKLMKANKERISFFEGIKKKFQGTLSPGALGGPVFGRLDLIFDSVKDVFYIIAVILTIVGVLSLPVLVFLIITYYVFKNMLSKFIIL
jgi:hypothetical protein